jgi:hypothetical protein
MAQFDVHRNSGKQRDQIPCVVVQSALFDDYGLTENLTLTSVTNLIVRTRNG